MFPLGVLSQPSGYPSLLTSLRAWYKLEEASGSRVDAHNATSGTPPFVDQIGTPGRAAAKQGFGLSTSGTNEALYVNRDTANAANLYFSGQYTIALWMYPETIPSIGEHFVLQKEAGSSGYAIGVYSSDDIEFQHRNSLRCIWNGAAINNWYHVIANYNSTHMRIKVNGGSWVTTADATGPNTGYSYSHCYLGRGNGGSEFFDGIIDEVGFWARTLTDEECGWLYNAGAGITYEDI